jgi:hypothetical protein
MVFPGKIKRNDGPEDTAFMEGRGLQIVVS